MKNGDKRYLVSFRSMGCKPVVTVLFTLKEVGGFVYDEQRLGRQLVEIQAQEWADGKWVNYD